MCLSREISASSVVSGDKPGPWHRNGAGSRQSGIAARSQYGNGPATKAAGTSSIVCEVTALQLVQVGDSVLG